MLDTNIVSEPLRPQPAPAIMQKLRAHEGEAAIPAPVWHELRFGCTRLPRPRRRDVIERYLEEVVLVSFPVLDYDRDAADWHAFERNRAGTAVCRRTDCGDRVCQRPDPDHCEYEPLSGIQRAAGTQLGMSDVGEGRGGCEDERA